LLPSVLELNKSFLDRLTSEEGAYAKSMAVVQHATEEIQHGQTAPALQELSALPPEVRSQRMVLLLRMAAAQQSSQKAYLEVITEWEKAFPNDPTLDAISIDGCFLRKDYSGAAAHLVALQKTTGPDGYLEILRASMQQMSGEHEAAVVTIRHALAVEPTMVRAYDVWFDLERKANNWKGLVVALEAFQAAFPHADLWHSIEADASWADFRASAECQAWHPTKPAAAAPAS
jgi:hypothetical protein